ncbi:MAG: hypothetical protein M1814_003646 [Vezdaea aestivalis]|nr:MAG: hypothetical protein M1814_003646 [Vezdaea aestivalis]
MAPAKKTQQKMSLGSFLQDETLGSWAEEMEDTPIHSSDSRTGYGGRSVSGAPGYTNSYTDRGFSVREELPLPSKPPYTAHLGNLSFDSTEGDIQDYFSSCQVTNVRIVEDRVDHKPKGFGYVEFATVDGLKTALTLNGTNFHGRNIRVSVADPPKDRPDAREFNDWTRKGPLPELPNQRRVASERTFGAPRNFDNASDAGSERGDRRRSPFTQQDDGKVRDLGNWERKGPLQSAGPAPPSRDGGRSRFNDNPRERRSSPQWGGSQEGSRPPRREFQEKPQVDRAPGASELDNQWRARMRPDPPVISRTPSREPSVPSSPAGSVAPLIATKPVGRPKLNLAKRTVSEADPSQPSSASADSKSSPFGAARPRDTQTREKQVEEKRELVLRQKREDDKAREEKKRAAKEAKESQKDEKPGAASAIPTEEKENNDEPSKPVEILKKATNGSNEDRGPEPEAVSQPAKPANGDASGDKSAKPREATHDARPRKTDGNNWRKASDKKSVPKTESPTLTVPDEDGWSTVQKTKNNRKSMNATSRAAAS